MKLVRFGQKGSERPGLIDADGVLRDLSDHAADIGPEILISEGLQKLKDLDVKELPIVDGKPRLGIPLTGIGKLVCIGLNRKARRNERSAGPEPERSP